MPVPVPMDVAAALADTGPAAVGVEDVKELVLWVGRGRGAQKRSSTPCSAPSEMSWSLSSLRPGCTSRRMTPSSSIRY